MLKERFITAIVLLFLVAIVLFVLPSKGFTLAMLLLFIFASIELTKMYNFDKQTQFIIPFIVGMLCLFSYFTSINLTELMMLAILVIWCFIAPAFLVNRPKQLSNLAIGVVAVIIFVPAFYAVNTLYVLLGARDLLSIFAVAWVSDTGAYFFGKKYGRNKLAPMISPSKTIEGALGGLVIVLLYFFILKTFHLVIYLPDYPAVFKFALALTTAGIVGDLFESWLKRVAKVKDSGNILPGHGGILDRVDSLVAIISVAFVMVHSFL